MFYIKQTECGSTLLNVCWLPSLLRVNVCACVFSCVQVSWAVKLPAAAVPAHLASASRGRPIEIFMLTYARSTTHQLSVPATIPPTSDSSPLRKRVGGRCEKHDGNRFLRSLVKFEAYHTHTHTVKIEPRWGTGTLKDPKRIRVTIAVEAFSAPSLDGQWQQNGDANRSATNKQKRQEGKNHNLCTS